MTSLCKKLFRLLSFTFVICMTCNSLSYASYLDDGHSPVPFENAYVQLNAVFQDTPTLEIHEAIVHLLVEYQRLDLLATHLAESEHFNTGSHRSLHAFAQGFSASSAGHYSDAEAFYKTALSLLTNANNEPLSNKQLFWQATILLHAAINQAYLQRYSIAIEKLTEVREEAKQNGWATLTAKADYFLGSVSYEVKDYETALVHYQRALANYPTSSILLIAEAKMAEAQMINIVGERTQAFDILEQAITTFDNYQDSVALAYAYLLKSYFLSKDDSHEASLVWIHKSVQLREFLGNNIDIANAYVHYAATLLENNMHEEAKVYGLKAIALAEENQDLSGQWDAYVSHAITLAELGEYKSAYEYMYKGERTLLKKARSDITAETARLNTEFNTEQQQLRNQLLDNKNTALEAQLRLNEQQQERQRWTMLGLSTLLVFVVCFIFIIYSLYKKNQSLATKDALTGIHNRRSIMELATQSYAISQRYQSELCVLMLDIDSFKSINDKFGHHIGDQVLKFVAHTAMQTLRESDLVGRIGGEEFLIVLPNTNAQQGLVMAKRLCKNIEKTSSDAERVSSKVTVSIGLSSLSPKSPSFSVLCNQADIALYAAKNGGKNRVEVYSDKLNQGRECGSGEQNYWQTQES